jgi:translation elongation factor EF-Tu-like GTPase
MERPDDIEAEVTFLPTEHGGRPGPAASGYRPQFYYAGEDWDDVQTYPGVEWVRPGETVPDGITSLNLESHRGRVFEGMPFLIREGNRDVRYGRVTRLFVLPGASGQPWFRASTSASGLGRLGGSAAEHGSPRSGRG